MVTSPFASRVISYVQPSIAFVYRFGCASSSWNGGMGPSARAEALPAARGNFELQKVQEQCPAASAGLCIQLLNAQVIRAVFREQRRPVVSEERKAGDASCLFDCLIVWARMCV